MPTQWCQPAQPSHRGPHGKRGACRGGGTCTRLSGACAPPVRGLPGGVFGRLDAIVKDTAGLTTRRRLSEALEPWRDSMSTAAEEEEAAAAAAMA